MPLSGIIGIRFQIDCQNCWPFNGVCCWLTSSNLVLRCLYDYWRWQLPAMKIDNLQQQRKMTFLMARNLWWNPLLVIWVFQMIFISFRPKEYWQGSNPQAIWWREAKLPVFPSMDKLSLFWLAIQIKHPKKKLVPSDFTVVAKYDVDIHNKYQLRSLDHWYVLHVRSSSKVWLCLALHEPRHSRTIFQLLPWLWGEVDLSTQQKGPPFSPLDIIHLYPDIWLKVYFPSWASGVCRWSMRRS